jgi:valyl-tRNA synthetase
MPFVTEELWSLLSPDAGSVMLSEFPRLEGWVDEAAERDQELLMAVITGIRNIRGEMNVPPSKKVSVTAYCADLAVLDHLKACEHYWDLAKVDI